MPLPQRSYDVVTPVYDALAILWSGGAILRAGAAVGPHLQRGDRVLMAGAGGGRDAAALVGAGVDLTLVDLSPRMLARAQARVARAGGQAEARCEDVGSLAPGAGWDAVCAHYFLNVFGRDELPAMFAALGALVRPGGLLSVADFAPPVSGGLGRLAQAVHYGVPLAVFAAVGLCARHPIYDYAACLPAGFGVERIVDHRIYGVGPRWHRTWLLRRALS